MDDNALSVKREELAREVHRQRGLAKTTGKPENAGKMKEMRKIVARINTIMHQRKTPAQLKEARQHARTAGLRAGKQPKPNLQQSKRFDKKHATTKTQSINIHENQRTTILRNNKTK
jgi:ribosomal protein L29